MHPKDISIHDFNYDLPSERIAHYPLTERDSSKLLIYRDGAIQEDIYRNMEQYLPPHSLLVFNNTKVVEARVLFQKPTGAQIELFCLEPPAEYGGMATAMSQTGSVRWKCLIGGASKWKPGQVLTKIITGDKAGEGEGKAEGSDGGEQKEDVCGAEAGETEIDKTRTSKTEVRLEARYLEKLEDSFLIELSWTPAALSFAGMLHHAGLIPLPPYIKRAPGEQDSERYQTVYARYDGSVAAPTAGLHFTGPLLGSLTQKGIEQTFVTLHVGAGTFLPVKSDTMENHTMHTEYISVSTETIGKLLAYLPEEKAFAHEDGEQETGRQYATPESMIIPVGTTSLRTIESLYWLGVKVIREPRITVEELVVHQWDPYERRGNNDKNAQSDISQRGASISPREALHALQDWMARQGLTQLLTRTQLLITPGYDWKMAGALVTNFHQPSSTLLLLVAAFIGEDWRKVYRYALDHGFRFLSYGDGSLLFRRSCLPGNTAGTPA